MTEKNIETTINELVIGPNDHGDTQFVVDIKVKFPINLLGAFNKTSYFDIETKIKDMFEKMLSDNDNQRGI